MTRTPRISILALIPLVFSARSLVAGTIYVDASAPGPVHDRSSRCDAHLHLQDALVAAARSGGTIAEVRIAQRTYKPNQRTGHVEGGIASTLAAVNMVLNGGYGGCCPSEPDARDAPQFVTALDGKLDGGRPFSLARAIPSPKV